MKPPFYSEKLQAPVTFHAAQNIARLVANVNKSDPFSYNRAMNTMRRNYDDPLAMRDDAERMGGLR